MNVWIPQSIQRPTLRKQHDQLGNMDHSHHSNIDPKESSDASLHPVDDTEDAKTERDLDKPQTDNMMGLRRNTPFERRISSSGTEAVDVLSQTGLDPLGREEGVREADDLLHVISMKFNDQVSEGMGRKRTTPNMST